MNKGRVKKIILGVLVFVVVFLGLTYWSENKAVRWVKGSWTGQIDMTDFFQEGLESFSTNDIDVSEVSFVVTMNLDFGKDGILHMRVDEDSWNKALEPFKSAIADYMRNYLREMLEEGNASMTVDEYLALNGTTIEEMTESAMSSFQGEDFTRSYSYLVIGDWLFLGEVGEELTRDVLDHENEHFGQYIYLRFYSKNELGFTPYGKYKDPNYLFELFETFRRVK